MNNFSVRLQGKTLEMWMYGVIGDDLDGITAKMVAEELKPYKNVSEIVIRMDSIGGIAHEGAAIYNILNRHQAKKIVTVDGVALSAMSLVAMVGDEILMGDNTTMMIHEPMGLAIGNASEHRTTADMLDKLTGVYASSYAARSGKDMDEMLSIMAAETWLTAEEAVEAGFATGIVESKRRVAACASIPKGWFKRTPAKMIVKDDAKVSLYREKLKELVGGRT